MILLNKNFRKQLFISVFFTLNFFVNAQQTAIFQHENSTFDKALWYYNEQQYLAAQKLFEQAKKETQNTDIQADCAYYVANCAIRLNQNGADQLIEQFVADYPASTKQNQAYLEVAQYYFLQGNYPQSITYYEKIDENSMSLADREKYFFQKGYGYFTAKNKTEAEKYLNKVINSKEFGSQAKYYLGYIAYEQDKYTEATELFNKVSDQNKYKEKMGYFQADMNFKLGNFQKAIDIGLAQLPKSDAIEKSELSKIVGESYFNLKKYDQSLPYLLAYKGKKGKWNNTDFYQLGYTYYKKYDYENAITQFNKIVSGNDALAQNAYYHLGESYLKSDKKPQALNAFKQASEMNFDIKMQEDAHLNYAKLSYEIGNVYQSVPEVLTQFLQKYPNTTEKQTVQNLLVSSFLTSKNYKDALELLEKNKTTQNKIVYQKVLFFRGLEMFNEGNYKDALTLFSKSIIENKDSKITTRATFWKAETLYNLEQFLQAIPLYQSFINSPESATNPEFLNVYYNLGYAQFKTKNYVDSSQSFATFTHKTTDKIRLTDAYLRLGDSQFMEKKYWTSLENYNKAIELKSVSSDYALFQKAMSYGFIIKNDKKIEDLQKLVQTYPNSEYADDAQFELGNTFVIDNKETQAIQAYDKLLTNYKNSLYVSKAILKQGLLYFNNNKNDLALTKLKKVVADYPKTPEALEAVQTAKLIYVENGNIDEYAAWVKTLNFVTVTDDELETTLYEAAEKQYLQSNTKAAQIAFVNYLKQFPNGTSALKANFYLAQLYFSDNQEDKSVVNYEFVINQARSEFTEQSLVRLSQVFLKQKNNEKAIIVLKRLETEANFPQNITYTQSNLMKSYYETKNYNQAVEYAEKVITNPKIDDKIKTDAQIIIARSAMQMANETKAREAYTKVLKTAKGELAAEALYYDAYFKNKDKKYKDSNKIIEKIAKDYSGYKYFGAKSLVIMAKNYYGLNDSFQAIYILENVVKNFTQFPDVITEAQTELNLLKTEESKRNSSITP